MNMAETTITMKTLSTRNELEVFNIKVRTYPIKKSWAKVLIVPIVISRLRPKW